MAIVLEPSYSRCQVRLQSGVDEDGDPIVVSRTYGRVLPSTTNDDFHEVFTALMALQSLNVYAIRRLEDGELINE